MRFIIVLIMALTLCPVNIAQQPPRVEIAENYIDLSFYKDLYEAQKDLDFEVLVPTYLPTGTEYRDYTINEFVKNIIISYNYGENITRFTQRAKREGVSSGYVVDPKETETTEIDILFKGEVIKATRHRHTERLHNMVMWEYGGYEYGVHAAVDIDEVLNIIKSITNIDEVL